MLLHSLQVLTLIASAGAAAQPKDAFQLPPPIHSAAEFCELNLSPGQGSTPALAAEAFEKILESVSDTVTTFVMVRRSLGQPTLGPTESINIRRILEMTFAQKLVQSLAKLQEPLQVDLLELFLNHRGSPFQSKPGYTSDFEFLRSTYWIPFRTSIGRVADTYEFESAMHVICIRLLGQIASPAAFKTLGYFVVNVAHVWGSLEPAHQSLWLALRTLLTAPEPAVKEGLRVASQADFHFTPAYSGAFDPGLDLLLQLQKLDKTNKDRLTVDRESLPDFLKDYQTEKAQVGNAFSPPSFEQDSPRRTLLIDRGLGPEIVTGTVFQEPKDSPRGKMGYVLRVVRPDNRQGPLFDLDLDLTKQRLKLERVKALFLRDDQVLAFTDRAS